MIVSSWFHLVVLTVYIDGRHIVLKLAHLWRGCPQLSTFNRVFKTYSLGEGNQYEKTLIPFTFNILTHFLSFSWQIIYLINVYVHTFVRAEGYEKVYSVYTQLNVDNCGRPWRHVMLLTIIVVSAPEKRLQVRSSIDLDACIYQRKLI